MYYINGYVINPNKKLNISNNFRYFIFKYKKNMLVYLNNIIHSISMNYKSWLCIIFSLYIIKTKSLFITFMNFIIFMIFSHISHLSLHLHSIYPMNIVHIYHHSHTNLLSHIIQEVLEFATLMSIIVFKYISKSELMMYVDDWTLLLFYLFYTTVHNINYGIFKVNNVHKIHHEVLYKNMGPDICDIIFNTKYKPELGLENTDHYIPNIIASTIIVKISQFLWNHKSNNKLICESVIKTIISISILFLCVISVKLHLDDINDCNERFQNQINDIIQTLKPSSNFE